MSQITNGQWVVGTISVVIGIVEIAVAAVVALKIIKPKGNEAYRYDLQWLLFGLTQITIGFMVIFG